MTRRARGSRRLKPVSVFSPVACERLEERTLLSALTVTGTAGNDTITLDATSTGGIKVTVNGTTKEYPAGKFDAVEINSLAGNDTINIKATVVPTTVSGEGRGIANVGNTHGVQDIKAALKVNAFGQGATLSADDTGDSTVRTAALATPGADTEQITGLAPATVTYAVGTSPIVLTGGTNVIPVIGGVTDLKLTTGSADDTVNVQSTPLVPLPIVLTPTIIPPGFSAGFITIDSSGGNDGVNIGDNGNARSVHGTVAVTNGAGKSTITIDDSADKTARTVNVAASPQTTPPGGAIAGLTDGIVAYAAGPVSSITLDGGSGGNTFTVDTNAAVPGPIPLAVPATAGISLTINSGAGDDTVTVNGLTASDQLTVNGGAGNDLLSVPRFGTSVLGNITFDGGTSGDKGNTLAIGAQDAIQPAISPPIPTVVLTTGKAAHGTTTIKYTNVQTLHLLSGAFEVDNDLGNVNLNVAGDSGHTFVEVNATQDLKSLGIGNALVALASGGKVTLKTAALDIGDGTLDLTDNQLQVHYGSTDPVAQVRQWIVDHKILTTLADKHHTVGYADSADGVVKGLAEMTVLVKYALFGDTNLDGIVDFQDLVILAAHYRTKIGAKWDQGDSNYDGNVNFADLVLLASNYTNESYETAALAAAVAPAPAPARRRK